MKNKLLLLITILLIAASTQAQTVISPNIDFQSERQTHILITTNDDQFIGKIISIHNNTVDFKLRNLENTIQFELSKVKFLGVSGEKKSDYSTFLGEKPNQSSTKKGSPMPSNRLLYSSSALPYRGKGSYRNTMLFWNEVDFQIGQHFNIGVASLIPALISIQAQANISLSDIIHAGINIQEFLITFDTQTANHSHIMLTIGDYEKYLNFSYGIWTDRFSSFFNGQKFVETYPALSLGGSYDFGEGWRFYIDSLIIYQDFDTLIFPSFNLSKHKKRSMFEIGLLSFPESGIPIIPIVSYNFVFR